LVCEHMKADRKREAQAVQGSVGVACTRFG
jgi:hypothetical protein